MEAPTSRASLTTRSSFLRRTTAPARVRPRAPPVLRPPPPGRRRGGRPGLPDLIGGRRPRHTPRAGPRRAARRGASTRSTPTPGGHWCRSWCRGWRASDGRPAGRGGRALRDQYTHVTDLLPTSPTCSGIEVPTEHNGNAIDPLAGTSLPAHLADPAAPSAHREQVYENNGHRGLYRDGWEIVTCHQAMSPTTRSGSCTTWPRTARSQNPRRRGARSACGR